MIKDSLQHSALCESAHPLFKKAFQFLRETNLAELPEGKHLIDGDNIFALVQEYTTKSVEGCQSESHKKHIDIQYVISGKELMGHCTLYRQSETKAYDEKDDYALYHEKLTFIQVNSGEFTVFFPQDIHMPCIMVDAEEKVKKVVIKIKV